MVAVPAPEDLNNLPDADQIRAQTDGFDDPDGIYVYQKRGPDADGDIHFDDFTDASITEDTDIWLCHTWDNEAGCVYYNLITRQAIYHVAVLDPGDVGDYPDSTQIKTGKDGFDAPALDFQTATYPYVSGDVDWADFTGGSPATDYLLCYVTGDEDPVYYQLTTTSSAGISGEIIIQITMDGTMHGTGTLAGESTIVVTPEGTIAAYGGMQGEVLLTVNNSALLNALGALVGNCNIIFNMSARPFGVSDDIYIIHGGKLLVNLGQFRNR